MKQEKINKYYLSGKISGLSVEDYTHNFNKARLFITDNFDYECDCEIINPLDIKPFLGVKTWLTYMISDILAQRKCNRSVFQDNWIDSKGAVIEYLFAKFIFKHKIIFI